jgi:hypothetical protein
MEATAIVREGGHAERRAGTGPDARFPGQRQMIRAAQVSFGASVLDCALLETSRGGARIHLLASTEVPEIVMLRMGGESWTLQRRWQKGLEVGFKVVGDPIPPPLP